MDKNTAKILKQLINSIIEEAEQNEAFAYKLEEILAGKSATTDNKASRKSSEKTRPPNRRDSAILDPTVLILEGEEVLTEKLRELTEKQLKDIIADYGMDPAKLAMKWKNKERLINHIIDASRRRASKGDAFRE